MYRKIIQRLSLNSLFARLLISFLIIILLAISFNYLSFTFFKKNINEETIKYNELNLNSTVQNFENYFVELRNTMLTMYFNDQLRNLNSKILQKESLDYIAVNQLNEEISQVILTEPMKYVHNLFYYIDEYQIVIDKDGPNDLDRMFNRFYVNKNYDIDFWSSLLQQDKQSSIYPNSVFSVRTVTTNSNNEMELMPFIVRGTFSSNNSPEDVYWGAFIDTQKMFNQLHLSINNNLLIVNDEGNVIFSSQPNLEWDPTNLNSDKNYYTEDNNYYFYKKGIQSGYTYINIIPYDTVNSKIQQLNFLLITLLVICIVLSTIISIFFSIRLNNPIKKIVKSIEQSHGSDSSSKSNIYEFDLIGDNLRNMIQTNQDITKVLEKRNSLLRNYAFTNRLKNIHTNLQEIKELSLVNKPFRFVFFDITFLENDDVDQDRATNFIREFINQFWLEFYPDSLTFQIENNQIISLIFENEEIPKEQSMLESVETLKKIFDLDRDEVFYTICLSQTYKNAIDLNRAYTEVQQLSQQRQLNSDTQIITKLTHEKPSFILTPNQEQEFRVHLLEGNEVAVNQWVDKRLNVMKRKGAFAVQFHDFSKDITNKVLQTLHSLQLEYDSLEVEMDQLNSCYTLECYRSTFQSFLDKATAIILQKKNEHDHISSFVMDYVEEHYAEDISLEIMGDKLNITGGYLSSYFKEKTGMNFSEYINALRIDKAKQFLQNTDLRIQDVAEQVGYYNVNSFIRMFKKINGITPGEFRKTASQQDKN